MTGRDDEVGCRKEAIRCRRLAAGIADTLTSERLAILADKYEKRAEQIRLWIRDEFKEKNFV